MPDSVPIMPDSVPVMPGSVPVMPGSDRASLPQRFVKKHKKRTNLHYLSY